MSTIRELFSANYGKSEAVENNFEECLSMAHLGYMVDFIERRQAAEEKAVAEFHAKGR